MASTSRFTRVIRWRGRFNQLGSSPSKSRGRTIGVFGTTIVPPRGRSAKNVKCCAGPRKRGSISFFRQRKHEASGNGRLSGRIASGRHTCSMSRSGQIAFHLRCIVFMQIPRRSHWPRIPFHLAGITRAIRGL